MQQIIKKYWWVSIACSPIGFLANIDGTINFINRLGINSFNMHLPEIAFVCKLLLSITIPPIVVYLLIFNVKIATKQKNEIALLKATNSFLFQTLHTKVSLCDIDGTLFGKGLANYLKSYYTELTKNQKKPIEIETDIQEYIKSINFDK